MGRWHARILLTRKKEFAIECDSFGFHSDKVTWSHDRERLNLLTAMGWQVLRFTWEDLIRRPEWIAALIRAALRRADVVLSKSSDA